MTKSHSTAYRTPEIVATSWSLTCPGCGESLPAPCGSLMWTAESFKAPSVVCECGARCRIPRRLREATTPVSEPAKTAIVGRMKRCGHVVCVDLDDSKRNWARLTANGFDVESMPQEKALELLRTEGDDHINNCRRSGTTP